MVTSAYIHIPFCRQKCHYCSFVSFPTLERKEQYLNSLCLQIEQEYKDDPLKTLYFGGGTPSLLTIDEVNSILKLFKTESNAEITLELNPETVNYEYFSELAKTRINRLSIGAQSFDDKILSKIGRKHKAEDIFRCVKQAREVGFENISLDFIYGLPEQSSTGFLNDLKTATNLGIEHISLYGLKIEEGCFFYGHPPKHIADDDMQAQMYSDAIELLTKNFEHYEISNFAKPDKYSQHNTNYWKNGEYYGFGLSAHGYVNGIRYSNPETFDIYCLNPCQKAFSQKVSTQERLEEEIFLGLRLTEGINIKEFNKKFDLDFEQKYKQILDKYTASGHLSLEDENCRFTVKGFAVSNYILADFIEIN